MKQQGDSVRLSASDLANHLGCRHLTGLDHAAARGEIRPPYFHDPMLDALQERGLRHEREYLDHLESRGLEVAELTQGDESAFERTRDARCFRHQVLLRRV